MQHIGTRGDTRCRIPRAGVAGATHARLEPILHRAHDVLATAIDELTRRGFVVCLANEEGIVLAAWGDPGMIDGRYRSEFTLGSRWDEQTGGTNAIGTALAENGAVSVIGRAHSLEAAHTLACYAALAGRRETARQHLDVAFAGNPKTREWAREDEDLASLNL